MKIPEGTQSGKELRIRGRGVPYLNERGKGDLIVKVVVQIPRKLNRAQRDLVAKLAEIDGCRQQADIAGAAGEDEGFVQLGVQLKDTRVSVQRRERSIEVCRLSWPLIALVVELDTAEAAPQSSQLRTNTKLRLRRNCVLQNLRISHSKLRPLLAARIFCRR